jgi:surface polysaccharide O-acyltransferase-like enzyme
VKKEADKLKSKTIFLVIGALLILIALILGAVQHFGVHNLYGAQGHKWYFYGLVVVIALVGLILAVWSLMKTEAPAKTTQEKKKP